LNPVVPALDKPASSVKIFIDGQGVLAHAITRKLLENHGIVAQNILVNTYSRTDNAGYVDWLQQQGITFDRQTYHDDVMFHRLRDFAPDYIIAAYGLRILPRRILDLARIVAFNLHPSYLPDYKGRWIPSWAIINGELEHGITIHVMDEGIDTGAILFQKKLPVALDDTAYSLYNKIVCDFITVFDGFFRDLINGAVVPVSMPSGGRYFGKNMPHGGVIDPTWDTARIERFIRSMFYPPHKGAEFKTKHGAHECLTLEDYLNLQTSTQI